MEIEMEANPTSIRDRVITMFQVYAPASLNNIDTIMKAYAGREHELIMALVGKYGPEPGVSQPGTATPDYPSRVRAMYQKYAPDKLNNVDTVLLKWAGKEPNLMTALVAKYGPEPNEQNVKNVTGPKCPLDFRSRLVVFYAKYAPDELNTVDQLVKVFAGKENLFFDAVAVKYGPEPKLYWEMVTVIFAKFAPDRLPLVDQVMRAYAGREKELVESFVKIYYPDPATTVVVVADMRSRVLAMFHKYTPDRVTLIDTAMQRFAGREQELIDALVAKYGPEPRVTPPGTAPDFPSRVRAMFRKYAPNKAEFVQTMLDKYAGREDELLEALKEKYGPEPEYGAEPTAAAAPPTQPAQPPRASPNTTAADPGSRVLALYQQYAPNKLHNVNMALQLFSSRESQLIERLLRKYHGVETQLRARVVSMFQHYIPSEMNKVDKFLEKYSTRGLSDDDIIGLLVERYGPEPVGAPLHTVDDPFQNNVRMRVLTMYLLHTPDKVAKVDSVLNAYVEEEDDLIESLVSRHGAEAQLVGGSSRDQAAVLVSRYAMSCGKMSEVGSIWESFHGREGELVEEMIETYVL